MAKVPYSHIEAPRVLLVDGVRAYNPGDPVPLDVAERLGLLAGDDAPPVLEPYGSLPAKGEFSDGVITVSAEGEPTTAAAGDKADPTTAAAGGSTPAPTGATAPAGAPPATPPQAPAKPPKQGA